MPPFTWKGYFARARRLEENLVAVGTPRKRARQMAQDLTARPLPRTQAARLLATVVRRRKEKETTDAT